MPSRSPLRSAPRVVLASLASWALFACGNAPGPAAPAAKPAPPPSAAPTVAPEPPDGPVPTLRTGSLAPVDHPDPVTGHVTAHVVRDGVETLRVEVPEGAGGLPSRAYGLESVVVASGDDAPLSYLLTMATAGRGGPVVVTLRRAAALAGKPASFDLYYPAMSNDSPGEHAVVHADDTPKTDNPALLAAFEEGLSTRLSSAWSNSPYKAFASRKMRELAQLDTPAAKKPKALAPAKGRTGPFVIRPTARPGAAGELGELMETTSGATAVQEALQHDRALFLSAEGEPARLPVAAAKGPALQHHPWAEMTKKMTGKVAPEPLADAAPAEFYYARAEGLTPLFRVMDQMDAWGTAAARALDGIGEDRSVAERYERELAVGRGPLTRALGPSVLGEVAMVGSDPYVKEGSDVTLLLRVRNRALFEAGLEQTRGGLEGASAFTTRKASIAGVDVTITESADKTVRQHRAMIGDLAILSNSPAAIARVLETIAGKHPRLSDEADFQYMLARDAGAPADILAYAGDRFVEEVVGARQKIGEARRQIALSELMTPGFASLLYGELYGKAPASAADLTKARLLAPTELAHEHGGPIAWRPGEPARSSWGTVAAMTPLIDLPPVTTITQAEKAGYERFVNAYEESWARYVDPIAVRLAFDDRGPRSALTMDLRELPLIEETRYRELARVVGAARFDAPPITSGARIVVGIGRESEVRRMTGNVKSLLGKEDLAFDFLGDWISVGMLDRAQVASSTLTLMAEDLPQAPAKDDAPHRVRIDDIVREAAKLPLYAAIAIRNPALAAIAIAAVRSKADESSPGMFHWGEVAKERDVPIVQVSLDEKRAKEEFDQDVPTRLFYAITHGAVLVSLNEHALRALIDERADGKGPKGEDDPQAGGQLALDLASDHGKGMWSSVAWMLETAILKNDREAAQANAEAVFRGSPEVRADRTGRAFRAVARAVFGAVPLAPDGGAFAWSKEGLVDPSRGSAYAPVWPSVPVPGSPVEALMTGISHAHAVLSFDDEPKVAGTDAMRSLHARVTIEVPKG